MAVQGLTLPGQIYRDQMVTYHLITVHVDSTLVGGGKFYLL